jgi:hypothetical protein
MPKKSNHATLKVTMKKCTICHQTKPLDQFYKNKSRKDGLAHRCKSCSAARAKIRRESNKEQIKVSRKIYYKTHKNQIQAKNRAYYQANKDKFATYHKSRLLETAQRRRAYYQEYNKTIDKEARKAYNNAYYHQQKNNPAFKIARNARTRIWIALKGHIKSDSTMDLIGCSRKHLMSHLESQFQSGMTWANYGDWHVDHVKPCASFDLSSPGQQAKCFHYSNLQPLWAADNFQKSDKIQLYQNDSSLASNERISAFSNPI